MAALELHAAWHRVGDLAAIGGQRRFAVALRARKALDAALRVKGPRTAAARHELRRIGRVEFPELRARKVESVHGKHDADLLVRLLVDGCGDGGSQRRLARTGAAGNTHPVRLADPRVHAEEMRRERSVGRRHRRVDRRDGDQCEGEHICNAAERTVGCDRESKGW